MASQHLNTYMRQLRVLAQGVWYEVRTRINNREPLFRHYQALGIFTSVFHETKLRFMFEVRGLQLEDDLLTFYIKSEDGLELPEIMKWMKQGNLLTQIASEFCGGKSLFEGSSQPESPKTPRTAPEGRRHGWRWLDGSLPKAERVEFRRSRNSPVSIPQGSRIETGDRYWSRIVEREPGEEAEGSANGDRPRGWGSVNGDRPHRQRKAGKPRFFLKPPFPMPVSPG
jgi:hypothetical protein